MKRLFSLLAAVALLTACSETKYVPEGMYLLDGVKLRIDEKSYREVNTGELKNYIRQRSNARWFSLFKLPLHTYSLSGQDSSKWMNRLLRNIGEPPVILDTTLTRLSCIDLRQALRNMGYLQAEVEMVPQVRGKKVTANYMLYPGQPYYVNRVNYQVDDPQIAQLPCLSDSMLRGIRTGQQFSVSTLDQERKRITQQLTSQGYFRFHKDHITFLADTTDRSRLVDITLWLHSNRIGLKDTLHNRYRIASVKFESGNPGDTLIHLRRHILHESSHIDVGDYYSATALRNTYNHFGRLGAVRYTNIAFTERPDTSLLDCVIQLQTNKPSSLSFQPEGTNTAGDLGAAASLTYQNRNLFRGSENLSIELRGAYEAIRGLEGYSNQDFVEYSLETRLQFPRFIAPFLSHTVRRKTNATSEVSLMYDLQNRPEFHRRLVSATWRYRWHQPQQRSQYQLNMLDLNYVFMPWISETFRHLYLDDVSSRNAILRYNYEDLFITKIGFGYSYNNGKTALKTNIETSGNILNACSGLLGADKDSRGQYRVFNIAFAQYVKADMDITRSIHLDYNNQLVFHLGLGVAYPYGNSSVLPFEKRYFSGGANSVRGWSVRRLGPGKYKGQDGRIDFINQTGDMKLDMNAEYRTHLFWKLGGALFVDAGNIWTLRNYKDQPGGQFSIGDFLSQIAVSYGLGLRFNFDYFIVRFDLGMKAINPAYSAESSEHYPLLHQRFSRDYAFHFAVGLPF